MTSNNFKLPAIGLRNIKTALGVFICILLYDLIGRPYVLFACISVIICLKETVQDSYTMAIDRMGGTIIGGLVGIPFLTLSNYWHSKFVFFAFDAVLISSGIVLVIYLCNLLNKKGATSTACVVFLSVMIVFQVPGQNLSPFAYSFNRMLDSAVGLAVAILVNKYIFPFENKQTQMSLGVEGDDKADY